MREAQAEVFDLGYQHYAGPREGRGRARRAVLENGVRTVLGIGRGGRAKVLPALLFLAAMAPAVVSVALRSLIPVGDALPSPADYYSIVGTVLVIFGAVMAPELLIPDRQHNVLQLYLVRPLTSTDYLAARFLAFFLVVLGLVYSGQIVFQAGLILTAEEALDYLRENWLDVPRFLGAGALIALFVTVIPMAVAALSTRRAYVAAFVIAAFLVSSVTVEALTSAVECEPQGREVEESGVLKDVCEPILGDAARYVALFNMFNIPLRLNDMIFDREGGSPSTVAASDLGALPPIGVYVLFTLGPGLFLWSRYRRVVL